MSSAEPDPPDDEATEARGETAQEEVPTEAQDETASKDEAPKPKRRRRSRRRRKPGPPSGGESDGSQES